MSIIAELGEKFKNLPDIIERYSNELQEAKENLEIVGKKLVIANSENSAWVHYYDQRRIEMGSLVKHFKTEEAKVRSIIYRKYKENYSIALTEREIPKYIDSEDDYIRIHGLLIEVEEIYEQYKNVVDAFTARNYTLTNITKLRIASLENIEI